MLWLVICVVFASGLCGMCSVLEATFLSVSMPALREQALAGKIGSRRLLTIRQERPADAISAILLVNTLAGMVGATFAGAAAETLWGSGSVIAVSVVMTLLLLFLSEIGPKTYAASHAAELADGVGRVLAVLLRLFIFLLPVFRTFTSLFSGEESGLTRHGLSAMIASAPDEGILSVEESQLISHIVYMSDVTIERLVTPLELTSMLPDTASLRSFIDDDRIARYSRIPIYKVSREQLVGYVAQRDVLRALAVGAASPKGLGAFINPLPLLGFELTVAEATRQLLASQEAIASVRGPAGRTLGIITLEDLLETLTGMEITDEPGSSLGQAYDPRRRERLTRLREKRDEWQAAGEESSK